MQRKQGILWLIILVVIAISVFVFFFTYRLVNKEIYSEDSFYRTIPGSGIELRDAPDGVTETRYLVVEKNTTNEKLRKILMKAYNRLRLFGGYSFSDTGPTRIMLYAYRSLNDFREGKENWAGKLEWDSKSSPEPKVLFRR